jgi:ABC-type nickel/cobalt efflux system permease component RcnA
MKIFLKGLVQIILVLVFVIINLCLVTYGFEEGAKWWVSVPAYVLITFLPCHFLSEKIMNIITSEKHDKGGE